jgi:hypothetical protein
MCDEPMGLGVEVRRCSTTCTRAYVEGDGFITLHSNGELLAGAYALGPEAEEWMQQATLTVRARVPLDVLRDTIQPFPTSSEIYVAALKTLLSEIAAMTQPVAVVVNMFLATEESAPRRRDGEGRALRRFVWGTRRPRPSGYVARRLSS